MVRCIHAPGLHLFHCSRHCARGLGGNDVTRAGDVPIVRASVGIPVDVTRASERVRAIGVAGADGNVGIGNVDKDVGVANAPLRAERGARTRPL